MVQKYYDVFTPEKLNEIFALVAGEFDPAISAKIYENGKELANVLASLGGPDLDMMEAQEFTQAIVNIRRRDQNARAESQTPAVRAQLRIFEEQLKVMAQQNGPA